MDKITTLADLKKGMHATIVQIGGEDALRQHFLDMGLIPGTEVTFVKAAPMGDPIQLLVRGYELTLRLEDARKIQISNQSTQVCKIKPLYLRKEIK